MSVPAFEIRPGEGIGPVSIGQTRDEARRAMEGTGEAVDSIVRWQEEPAVLAMCGNSFQVYFDAEERVEEIEVMGSGPDAQERGEEPPIAASYLGVDLFRTPALEVAALVGAQAAADESDAEHGPALSFPTLGLALWRDDHPASPPEEWAEFFMTALVRRPSSP